MPDDLDLLAAALRADARDVDGFFDVLVARLSSAFPDRVQVRRGGLLGRARARSVTIALGDRRYEAERHGGRVETRVRTVVRGIAIAGEPLEPDGWIDALSADLVAEAERSERARAALEELLAR